MDTQLETMKIKTLTIPIYNSKLTIILTNDLKEVELKYKCDSLENYSAVVLAKRSNYVVAFNNSENIEKTIAHEVVHLKNYIFKDCGVLLDIDNDESEAYLTGWLFETIYKFINKHKN